MSWRDVIGNLLEKFDGPTSSPLPPDTIADPFNYSLALSLGASTTPDSTLPHLLAKFPALSPQEASALVTKCNVLIHQAVLVYYKVRDGQVSEAEAEAQVKQATPQMNQQNFNLLRARCHIVTSK